MNYWQQRFLQMENAQNDKSIKKVNEIQKQFEKAQAAVEEKLNAWYQRFARNNAVSMAEAKRMLSAKELKEFKWSVEEYIKHGEENELGGKWRKELENASARVHISRLEALKVHIQQEIEKLYGNCTDSIDKHIKESYLTDYYHTVFEIQKGTGIGYSFEGIDSRLINNIIIKPWAVDEINFSDRLWKNKTKLINTLHNALSRMCITGEGPDRAISEIAKEMNASRRQASTIVMTESAAFANEARRDCMKKLGVEQFEVVETLDSRTCDICGNMDGRHYNMSDFQIGVTAPPFHPNCRGCTVPYFGDEYDFIGKRAARGEDGKTYFVPADTTYQEWKESFVDGDVAKDRFGIITNNNKSSRKYYDFKGKDIKTVESEISQLNYEVGVCFDKNGKAVFAQIGNEDTIEFTAYQLKKMKGLDITHNHPLSTPPSPEDLYLLKNYKANSFRTAGKNGTYVLQYSKEIENLPDFEVFSNEYDAIINELSVKYKEKVKGGLNECDAIIIMGEEIWGRLCKKYNIVLEFKRKG